MASEATYDPTPPLDKSIAKEAKRLEDNSMTSLAKQCDAEFNLAWEHQKPKKDETLTRLRIFNNQKRKKDTVGDTTMFSTFQTVLASLYSDQLTVKFSGREEGDTETADQLNAISKYDYDEMGKDQIDYDWDWDTLFTGHGLTDMYEFIREPDQNVYIPIPRVIDITTFLRDPRAVTMNGNRLRRGAARFWGEEIKMTQQNMQDHPHFLASNNYRAIKFGSSVKSLLEDARQARDEAQGLQYDRDKGQSKLGANGEYSILQWNTHWKVDGVVRKVRVWLANGHKDVVGFQILKEDRWKVVDRLLYPTAHDWDGASIPDLTEDKNRARAILQNQGLKLVKADLYPSYIYDSNRIKNKNDFNKIFNKYIAVDVPEGRSIADSVMPMRGATPNIQLLNFIYSSLDLSAQKATATSEIQQGIQSQKDRPLGETELLASQGMQRYSLSQKIWGWSDKGFWFEYYGSYKENFDDHIDEKIIRIDGALGQKWRKLTKNQFITDNMDPDIEIKSLFISKQEQIQERNSLTQFFSLALQDPGTNRRFALKELARGYGMESDRINLLLPLTVDERIAQKENELLSKNIPVQVNVEDDHMTHLIINNEAADTPAKYAHMQTHIKALSIKKVRPDLFPADQQVTPMQPGQNGQTNMGPGQQNPMLPSPAPTGPSLPAQSGQ